ncbi:MAG: PH domain-containing protein [Actinomycetia bacterium]|nr:PH domain-containing protein [Actinomycetes bacterium]
MAHDDGPIQHFGGGSQRDDRTAPARRGRFARTESARGRIAADIERAERNPHLRDHLGESERIRIGTRQHPIVLLKPVLAVIAAFALLLRSLSDSSALSSTRQVFLAVFLVAVLWLGGRWLQWSRNFFLATDFRILKMYGVLSTTVDSMKVPKVTDMKYHRSFIGEILGYGSITIESAGQDQALHDIEFIPYPRENYQELSHIIIGEDPRTGGLKKHRFRRRVEALTRRRSEEPISQDDGYDELDGYDESDFPEEQRPDTGPRMLYSSEEGRSAPTSPIPIYPPGYFDGDAR